MNVVQDQLAVMHETYVERAATGLLTGCDVQICRAAGAYFLGLDTYGMCAVVEH